MKVVAVVCRKGGVGKTTVAVNLAAALSKRCRVALVDLDPQQSAARWSGSATTVLQPAALPASLERISADVVVVDCPPHEHPPSRAAFAASDVVIVPVQPSPLDLDAAEPVLRAIADSGKAGLVVLTMVSPSPNATATALARQHLATCGVPIAETVICRRAAHVQAVARRLPVTASAPGSKAAAEVRDLAAEVWAILGGLL